MKIETKYEIGQRIWIVYKRDGEVSVYDDYITSVVKDNERLYYTADIGYQEYKEDEIILYEDTNKLVEKIKELLNEIAEEE